MIEISLWSVGVKLFYMGGGNVNSGVAKTVGSAGLSVSDATWFARWLERYARWTSQTKASRIDIQTEPLIQLLRQMRDVGKKAFVIGHGRLVLSSNPNPSGWAR